MKIRHLPACLVLLSASAMAETPGPTDPSGPRLDPARSPAPAMGRDKMDEQIRRGTLVDPRDEADGAGSTDPQTAPPDPGSEERRPPQPLESSH